MPYNSFFSLNLPQPASNNLNVLHQNNLIVFFYTGKLGALVMLISPLLYTVV